MDLDTIIKLLDEQRNQAIALTTELNKLEQAQQNLIVSDPIETEEMEGAIIESPTEHSLEDEMEYYINNLSSIDLTTPEIIMKALLPSIKNKNAVNILLRLKLECIKNMREINEMLIDIDDIPSEDLIYFKQALSVEEKKLEMINKRLYPETTKTEEQEENLEQNKLIFVPTAGGNIRVLEELKSIPKEYYERFYGLFYSIKDSTFKNVKSFKRLNNSDPLFCEVKDTAVRVMFVRIGPQEYAVITAFVKKTDNNKGYRNQLEQKMSDYKQIAPLLIANLDDEEFLSRNSEYETALWNMLHSPSEKGGPKQYVRRTANKLSRNTKTTKQ